MMKRAGCLIIIVVLLVTTLTACYDAVEVNNWSFVYAIGVDKGVTDKLRFTVQMPSQKGTGGAQGSSGGQGQISELINISIDCPTLYAGVDMINVSISRTLNYMHTILIVVSEDFAKEGISAFVEGMKRAIQIRRSMYFMVVKGEASKFIEELNPVLGVALSKFLEGMALQGDKTALFDDHLYEDFISQMKSTKGQPNCILAAVNDFSNYLPEDKKPKDKKDFNSIIAGEVPRKGGNKFDFLGTALFNGDKMVGELNGEQTRAMLMITNEFNLTSLTIPDPIKTEMFATASVKSQKSTSVKVYFSEDKPIIHVKVFLEGDLVHLQSDVNYESKELKPKLEEEFKSYVKKCLDETISKCKDLSCDVFEFGNKASMNFLSIQEWEAYNWNKQFKNAEITTEVEFILRRTGTVIKTNPVKASEDKKE